MLVTEFGMVMRVKLLQRLNAESPILVTESGITVFWQPAIKVLVAVSIIALQLLRLSYTVLPESTAMLVKLLQPRNAYFPMLVTEFGMVILVKLLQSSNAYQLILVYPLGMTTLPCGSSPKSLILS